jgi:hypothetical protein
MATNYVFAERQGGAIITIPSSDNQEAQERLEELVAEPPTSRMVNNMGRKRKDENQEWTIVKVEYRRIEGAEIQEAQEEGKLDELCSCGHLKSQHGGLNGHGVCNICGDKDEVQFTWTAFVRIK